MIKSIWLLPIVLLLSLSIVYGQALAEYPVADSGTTHRITPADFELLDDHGLPHSCPAVICPGYERENTSDRQFAKYEISTAVVSDGDTVIFTDGTYDIVGPIVIRHANLTISSDDGEGVLIRSTDNKGLVFRNFGDVSGLEIRGFYMASAETTQLAPARNFGMVFVEHTAGLNDIKILDNTFRGYKQNGVRIGSSDQSSLFTNVEIRDNSFQTIPADRNPVHLSNAEVTLFANSFERSDYLHLDGTVRLMDLYSLYPGKPDGAPAVTAPPAVDLEATDPLTAVTPEQLGEPTVTDDTDPSPVVSNDSPGSFAVGNHTVTWTATDSTGNSDTATQTVTIRDTTPPDVTLLGDSSVTVERDGTYKELSATCTDIVDGSLTITTDGVVDTSTPGEYTLKYSCTDAAGNPASVTRTVTVAPPASTQPTDLGIANSYDMGNGWRMMSINWIEPSQSPASGYEVTVTGSDGTPLQLSTFGLLIPFEDSRAVSSYDMDGSRDPDGDFVKKNPHTQGIDIRDDTIYLIEHSSPDLLTSYRLDGTHIPVLTHNLPDAGRSTGLTAHDGKVWVTMRNVSGADSRVFSYDPTTGTRAGGFFTHTNNAAPTGITELGGLLYVLDGTANSVFAYRTDGTHVPDMSFGLDPATVWAKGISAHPETNTMWVLDNTGGRVYAYSPPDANGTRSTMFSFVLESGRYGGIAVTPAETSDTITVPADTNRTAYYYYAPANEDVTHTVQTTDSSSDPPAMITTRRDVVPADVFHDSFDSDLGTWTYQERPYDALNSLLCGVDNVTNAYTLTQSGENGGSAHMMNSDTCWFGFSSMARTFDIPAEHEGGDLTINLDYRSQTDSNNLSGGHANNLFYTVTDSTNNDLAGSTIFLGTPNDANSDSGWNNATISVNSLHTASCPCEIILYTADMGWDEYNKRFYIDNVNATLVPGTGIMPPPVISPTATLFQDTFDFDLERWSLKEVPIAWANASPEWCNDRDKKSTYVHTHSSDHGGSVHVKHVNGPDQCWFGNVGISKMFDVPAEYDGGELSIVLNYRSLGDKYAPPSPQGHLNNLHFDLYSTSGAKLTSGIIFQGDRQVLVRDTQWDSATFNVQSLSSDLCPCEIFIYTFDDWQHPWDKQFYIDDIYVTITK